MSERLRNLGSFTFADAASFRLDRTSVRLVAATGSLVVVLFYLVAQMIGAGKLVQLLFGVHYIYAIACVGALMIVYVTVGGMQATTWVQITKAVLLLAGGTLMGLVILWHHRCEQDSPEGCGNSRAGRTVRRTRFGNIARTRARIRDRRPSAHTHEVFHSEGRGGRAEIGLLRDYLRRLFQPGHTVARIWRGRDPDA
jgi:hypothetical protein